MIKKKKYFESHDTVNAETFAELDFKISAQWSFPIFFAELTKFVYIDFSMLTLVFVLDILKENGHTKFGCRKCSPAVSMRLCKVAGQRRSESRNERKRKVFVNV